MKKIASICILLTMALLSCKNDKTEKQEANKVQTAANNSDDVEEEVLLK